MTKMQVTPSDRGERRGPENDFWLSRTDGWVIKKRMKRIILLEFKRTSDASETYHTDMKKIADTQRTPILTGPTVALETERQLH